MRKFLPSRRSLEGRRLYAGVMLAVLLVPFLAGVALPRGSDGIAKDVPPALEAAVSAIFATGDCVDPGTVVDRMQSALAETGHLEWTIRSGGGIRPDGCVSAGFDPVNKHVVLVPVASRAEREAIDRIIDELRRRCLNQAEARGLIEALFAAAGATHWEVRSDGPISYPEAEREAVIRHMEAGCYVFSGSGAAADGLSVIYISGPPSLRAIPGWSPGSVVD